MKIIILFLLSITLAFASTQDALAAYKNKEYTKAFKLYSIAAKAGDVRAQNALSYLYFNGVGTVKDKEKGLEWLQKAANLKDKRACLDLGLMYLSGINLQKDDKKAFHYLSIASKKGDNDAKYNLALMYYNGAGVKQDTKKAASLLEELAKAGDRRAKQNIGRVYMQILDFKKAKFWLQKNVKEGDIQAQTLLNEIDSLKKD